MQAEIQEVPSQKYVLFEIGGQKYALRLEDVVEVLWMVALTHTPVAHEHIEGVINLRGKILPILNIRRRLKLPETPYGLQHRILVVLAGGRSLGFVVDSVSQVEEFARDQVEPPREFDDSLSFIDGMMKFGNQIVFCVDLAKLVSEQEIRSADQVAVQIDVSAPPQAVASPPSPVSTQPGTADPRPRPPRSANGGARSRKR